MIAHDIIASHIQVHNLALITYQIVWRPQDTAPIPDEQKVELYYTCSDNSYIYYTSVGRDAPFWMDPADASDVLRRISK